MKPNEKWPEIKSIRISDLTFAPYNPPNRTKADNLKRLEASIKKYGLLVPILITKDLDIIEGHKRATVCRNLGWRFMPCNVAVGPQDELYAEVNATQQKLSGNDTLSVYLKNPNAVTDSARKQISTMESVIGRDMVEKLCKRGRSISTYRIAKALCDYCGWEADDQVRLVVAWVMQFGVSQTFKNAIEDKIEPTKLISAVRNMKPIRVSYKVG